MKVIKTTCNISINTYIPYFYICPARAWDWITFSSLEQPQQICLHLLFCSLFKHSTFATSCFLYPFVNMVSSYIHVRIHFQHCSSLRSSYKWTSHNKIHECAHATCYHVLTPEIRTPRYKGQKGPSQCCPLQRDFTVYIISCFTS